MVKTKEQFDFDVAFMNSASVMAIPAQRPWSSHRRSQSKHRRSNSLSGADNHHRRFLGHSRTSSGSRSSHDTTATSLHTDRSAAAHISMSLAGGQRPVTEASRPSHRLMQRRPSMDPSGASPESALSTAVVASSAPPSSSSATAESFSSSTSKPFVTRHGRLFLNEANLPYPLPVDLAELHHQSLRTMLQIQLFGAPVCSPQLKCNPPERVLEVGCGSGAWSMMCNAYYKSRGHGGISFTGIDIAPLCPEPTQPHSAMDWTFVRHNLVQFPWPLPRQNFDLVMIKDMSLAITERGFQELLEESVKRLRPGGTLEIWDSDHLIRALRPHERGQAHQVSPEQAEAASLGAYPIAKNTPISAPQNSYFLDYNNWITRALAARSLSAVPCTRIGPALLQESPMLVDMKSRRLAVPLNQVRWEREGPDLVVPRDSSTSGDSKATKASAKALTAGQIAVRSTALLTVVQQIQALGHIVREVNGKSSDEWEMWVSKMMNDVFNESGAIWGECLEVGAWWATRQSDETTNATRT
ncbi:hypothetical protein CDD82_6188 [Ophiocordyceps australis]|uniref:Methyltransferase domain-containing protein n=1 Tax=Ophiocordyceps australis TaxID=1399860 RepID=A0A2C5YWC8_9HYPO|nr:hypothetical protein CDD82_6188 [Ophiocordyceps australis]